MHSEKLVSRRNRGYAWSMQYKANYYRISYFCISRNLNGEHKGECWWRKILSSVLRKISRRQCCVWGCHNWKRCAKDIAENRLCGCPVLLAGERMSQARLCIILNTRPNMWNEQWSKRLTSGGKACHAKTGPPIFSRFPGLNTVDGERFARLNIRVLTPCIWKFSRNYFWVALAISTENSKKRENLAQWIFPRL